MSSYSREDKLFILAKVCLQNNLTPDSPAYIGLIKRVCASKLSMSLKAAEEYAADLTTAYRADKWTAITNPDEETAQSDMATPAQSEAQPPRVNDFKTLTLKEPYTPVKTVPHKQVEHPELSPKTTAEILLRLAHNDEFNGVGRLTLAQVRYELQDKSLQLQDVTRLLSRYAPHSTIETRPGNVILIYFDGKDTVQYHRAMHRVKPETLALNYVEDE